MCDSPAPGRWEVDVPYGWEDDLQEAEYVATMAETYPEYREDPIMKALRREAEDEQDKEWADSAKTPQQYAKIMKETFNTKKALDFGKTFSNLSINSYETDDFMSQPDSSILENYGEIAYIQAYEEKAKQHKKLRKLLSEPPTPVKSPSPKKFNPSAKTVKTPKKVGKNASPKMFAMPDLSSDSDEEAPPLPSFNKLALAGKKNFFAPPFSPKQAFFAPASSPKPVTKKGFFVVPVASDSDDDMPVPVFKPKVSIGGKKFFTKPSSPEKMSPFKKAGLAAFAATRQEMFSMKALNSKLHERLEYLQKVQIGKQLYTQSLLLPNNVNTFLASRKKNAGYLELALDIENLIINAMITKIEAGVTQVNANSLLNDARNKLKDKYMLLADNLSAIGKL